MTSTRLALGTASLHHLARRLEREALILAARDAGISHFDTSPLYGFGIAERALGVLSRDADNTTIATKVGLYPPGGTEQGRVAVWGRKALGKLIPELSKPLVDLSVKAARRSLDASLRRLGRERVDLLLLHEPEHLLFPSDEWRHWLDTERDRIGAIGVAGEAAKVLPWVLSGAMQAQVVQTRDSADRQEAEPIRRAGRSPQFTYGHLARRPKAQARDVGDILRQAIARHPETVLVVSTRRLARIHELSAACA